MAYQNFYATKLGAALASDDVTATVQVAPSVTSGWLVLEARNSTQREIVAFTGVSGNTITGLTRGQQGTAAVAHASGTSVEMNPTAQDFTDALAVNSNIPATLRDLLSDSDYEHTFAVLDGLDWSKDTNLIGDMTAGAVYINGQRIDVDAIEGKTFTASKDTYVSLDSSGEPTYTEAVNGAAQPATPSGEVLVAKVVTDGSEITTITALKDRPIKDFLIDPRAFDGLHAIPRLSTNTSAATLSPDLDAANQYEFTALAAGLTINAPVNMYDGDALLIRIKDNGTARALTFNAAFVPMGDTLPTTTVLGKWIYIPAMYNAGAAKWHVFPSIQEE